MGAMAKAVEVKVTGRVQGVAFRAYAEQQARRLGVAGWVRNEPDGSVAGHFEGDDGDVDALVAWCHDGPPMARVSHVAVRPAAVAGHQGFGTRF